MKQPRPSASELGGMTINERLFACGLLDSWDIAARKRDREAMIALLIETAVTRVQAESTVDTILENPSKYGF